jgi:protein TonB
MIVGAASTAAPSHAPAVHGPGEQARRLLEHLLAYRVDCLGLARPALLGLVIACHAALALPLLLAEPTYPVIVEQEPLHVRMVAAAVTPLEQQVPPPPADTPPPRPPAEALLPAPPEDTLPPRPPVEAMLAVPQDDLPPPVFVVPVPRQPVVQVRKQVPPAPAPAPKAEVTTTAEDQPDEAKRRTVALGNLALVRPVQPVYPRSALRAGNWGLAVVRTLIDDSGTPTEVSVDVSSGFGLLDESAADAVRLARFKPYEERGSVRSVWVLIPVQFMLIGQR